MNLDPHPVGYKSYKSYRPLVAIGVAKNPRPVNNPPFAGSVEC